MYGLRGSLGSVLDRKYGGMGFGVEVYGDVVGRGLKVNVAE